jgi:hypothetical protein
MHLAPPSVMDAAQKNQSNRQFSRFTKNNKCKGEFLARDAQQQAGQQDIGQIGHELIAGKGEHGWKYIGFLEAAQE